MSGSNYGLNKPVFANYPSFAFWKKKQFTNQSLKICPQVKQSNLPNQGYLVETKWRGHHSPPLRGHSTCKKAKSMEFRCEFACSKRRVDRLWKGWIVNQDRLTPSPNNNTPIGTHNWLEPSVCQRYHFFIWSNMGEGTTVYQIQKQLLQNPWVEDFSWS